MEITREGLKDIERQALKIGEAKGYKAKSYSYVYVSIEQGDVKVVYRNTYYGESDDVEELCIPLEWMNTDVDVLKKQWGDAKAAWEAQQALHRKQMEEERILSAAREEKALYKRLHKKYGNV